MKRHIIFMVVLAIAVFGGLKAQTKRISGTVTDKGDGSTLPGVSVIVEGTTIGTVTNIDGGYSLEIPDKAKALVFSFIGMTAQTIAIEGKSTIDVILSRDITDLEEVVVTGYGIKRKGTYTGSVEVVSAEKLEQVPVASFDQVLQGQASGVAVVGSSGAPGSAATIRIRGISSINAANEPLYIMDGIPITAAQFSALNQNDIENVTILKDATATSLYGSRASNGVIVITTKRGILSDRPLFTYRGQYGINMIARDNFEMMNSEQKIRYEEEIGLKTYTPEEKYELLKTNTNWLDEVLRNALTKSHEISVRGGNDKTKYYVSAGYYDQEGIQYRSDFKRYTYRTNLDMKISDKANMGTNFTVGYEKVNQTVTGTNNVYNPIFSARLLNPYLKPYNEDGSYNNEGLPWANPIEQLELNDDGYNRLKIVGGIFFDIEILKNLTFKTNVGIDYYNKVDNVYRSPESAWGASKNGVVSRKYWRNFRITPTNTLTYRLKINQDHDLNLLAGQEIISDNFESFGVAGKNIPNSKLKVLDVTTEIDEWSGDMKDYSVASFFGNASYNYRYKYLVDMSIRRDGSSRFGANSRWGTFWSAGIGWNMQEETFIKNIDWIDQLKLRASVGETGNYEIGDYKHMGLFIYRSYMGNNAASIDRFSNDDLTWEKKLKKNLALDLSIFRRYRAKIELYDEKTTDMLYYVPFSLTSGVEGGMKNTGEMSNKGIEFEVDADIIKTNDFLFNFNFNVAYNKNEILELYGGEEEIDMGNHLIKEGESYGTFYQVKWAGVNPANGKGLWYTADGQVTDAYSDVNRVLESGKTYLPNFTGGFTTNLKYKNLSLSAFFSWMADKWMVNSTRYFIESNGMFASYNQSVEMLDYWQQPGDVARNPHPKYNDNYYDSRLLEDASFLRLKNLTISYDFNSDLIKKTGLFRSARIYLQGQNILTFTNYTGIDPEFYGLYEINMYPHVKTYSCGIDIGF